MHFFYIDEAGCNLRDLTNTESPIFTLGGIIVKDKGWNKTHTEYEKIVNAYFDNSIPENFELHSHELLSPNGDGFFENHDRARRNKFAIDILNLLVDRGHQTFLHAVHKERLNLYNTSSIRDKDHVELKTPYLLAYENSISMIEWYVKVRLGSTARGMVIIDEKDSIKTEIEGLTKHRRFHPTKSKRIKWISEFSYPIDSRKNPMVQISDLVCFSAKKYLEIENGYRDGYPSAAKDFYRDLYRIIDERLIKKTPVPEEGRYSGGFNTFINNITAKPARGWDSRTY
ncbi:DUF3800 domain-containing protein [Gaetbulibacter aquiaggeris]|uniref:DUF3800 domain-containing protein n=1 Tax=Gaetbulibacter aquiaggeris TaxID=1735373 RepID=A0ABW7MNR3_9FLAO